MSAYRVCLASMKANTTSLDRILTLRLRPHGLHQSRARHVFQAPDLPSEGGGPRHFSRWPTGIWWLLCAVAVYVFYLDYMGVL